MRLSLRLHHALIISLMGVIGFSALAVLTVDSPAAHATCASGSGVVITSPSPNTLTNTTSGIITLKAASTPTTATGLTFMALSSSAQKALGEAVQSGTDWQLAWDSRNIANGTYQLIAVAHFGTATSLDCSSAALPLNITNNPTQPASLTAGMSPTGWQGPIGGSVSFTIDPIYTDQYGRVSHVVPSAVHWHSTLGSAAPDGGLSTVFTAGTVTGTSAIQAEILFNGLSASAVAQVKVGPIGTSTSTSGGSGSGGSTLPPPTVSPVPLATAPPTGASPLPSASPVPLSSADATRLAAMPTIFRPAEPTNTAPVVTLPTLSCLEKAVGALRFTQISSGQSAPTAAERKLAADCFSGSDPIPAVLAPVAPLHLTELGVTQNLVTVGAIKQHVITTKTGQSINSLLISGTGAPNTNVFIYVFSDPLVLRAETDSQGKWSYVLENPLATGHHEVYAVAEQDSNTFVRTSAVPVQVAAASAPGTTVDGAVVVTGKFSSTQVAFAAAASVLMVVAFGLFIALLRRSRQKLALQTPVVETVASLLPEVAAGTPPTPTTPAPTAAAPAAPTPTTPAEVADPHDAQT